MIDLSPKTNLLLALTAALIALSLAACDQLTEQELQQVERHRVIGRQHLTGGNHQDALVEYNAAIEIDDGNAEIYLERANAYIGLGAFRKAIEDLDEASRLDPESASALTPSRATPTRASASTGAPSAPTTRPSSWTTRTPGSTTTVPTPTPSCASTTRLYVTTTGPSRSTPQARRSSRTAAPRTARSGSLREAIRDFAEAIHLDPDNAAAYYNRGAAYSALGEFDIAFRHLDEAHRLDPDNTGFPDRRWRQVHGARLPARVGHRIRHRHRAGPRQLPELHRPRRGQRPARQVPAGHRGLLQGHRAASGHLQALPGPRQGLPGPPGVRACPR